MGDRALVGSAVIKIAQWCVHVTSLQRCDNILLAKRAG